jgi:hypothetical protein
MPVHPTDPTRRNFLTQSSAATMTPQKALFLDTLHQQITKRTKARNSLIEFTTYVKPNYKANWHHNLIGTALDRVVRGELKRLMIFMPPRHGKSELSSRKFPAYYLGHHPNHEFISASYSGDLAMDFGRDVRNLLLENSYKALFPKNTLSEDSQAKNKLHTSQGGMYFAVGVGGSTTGRGANVLNIDDPVKDRAEAESPVYRESLWEWYKSVAYPRLMPGGAIVLTMTRWHEDDLAGKILNQEQEGGEKWEKLILPAMDETGQALWPQAFPAETLKGIKATIGPHDWASLYDQRPRPIGGAFFSESDLLHNNQPVPFPASCDGVFAIIDSATKTGNENDGTAVTFFARNRHTGFPLVVLDWDIIQIEGAFLELWLPFQFKYLEELATETQARNGSLGVWIEDKSSGMVLLQQCNEKNLQATQIDSILTSIGKKERAINASSYVYKQQVKFTDRAYNRIKNYKGKTKNHLLSQILDFRVGSKGQDEDDALDTFCYGTLLALGSTGSYTTH